MPEKIKRYPSIRAFKKSEASLFIGRDLETRQLFNKVNAERTVLLFARSGVGKSSLINAGLLPMLEERGFLPVRVRMSASEDPTDYPDFVLKNLLAHYLDKDKYEEFTSDLRASAGTYEPGLWEYVRCCHFPLASTPVLIFDQFEQFFTFKTALQDEFMKQLNTLLTDNPPPQLVEWQMNEQNAGIRRKYSDWLTQPDIRVLFAIRSDRIFEMNRLTQFMPGILRSRFELYPLGMEEALKAIVIPAMKENPGLYISPPFQYSKDLLAGIVERLKGGNDIIETTQLQIICSEIENKIVLAAREDTDTYADGKLEVNGAQLKKIGGVENIVSNFYTNQLKELKSQAKEELARRLIEDNLYDRTGRSRKLLFEDAALGMLRSEKKTLGLDDLDEGRFLRDLSDLRLIRSDTRENRRFYEISHDYLLDAIAESSDSREARRLADINNELQARNEVLRELKERSEQSEIMARDRQLEAEKERAKADAARAEADKERFQAYAAREEAEKERSKADATRVEAEKAKAKAEEAKAKVELLKKRNERIGIAFFVVGLVLLVFGVLSYRDLRRTKKSVEDNSRRYSKLLVNIFDNEAEKRYLAGERILAYALWDSAASYSSDDSFLSKKTAGRYFPPFAANTESDIDVSDDLAFVATRNSGNNMMLWKVDSRTGKANLLLNAANIRKFYFLPGSRVLTHGLDNTLHYYEPVKDTVRHLLDSFAFSAPVILPQSNLLITDSRTAGEKEFFRLDNLRPATRINQWLVDERRRYKIRESSRPDLLQDNYSFIPVGTGHLMIVAADPNNGNSSRFYLYNLKDSFVSKPVRIGDATDLPDSITGSKMPVAFRRHLSIFDVLSGRSEQTNIILGESDPLPQLLSNDDFLLVEKARNAEDFETTSFSLYDTHQWKTILHDIYYTQLLVQPSMGILAYTDSFSVFHLYDARSGKELCREANVADLRLDKKQSRVYLALPGKRRKIVSFGDGIAQVVGEDGNMPLAAYGDRFYKFLRRDSIWRPLAARRTGNIVLEYQDSASNKISVLRKAFSTYIKAEIRKLVEP